MNTWDEATRIARDTETKARILGVQSQMQKFSFGVYLGEMILRHSDNLSKTLQSNTICAAEGKNVAGMVVLEKLRSSEAFDLFWQKSLIVQKLMVLENQICLVHIRCLKGMRMAMHCVKFTINLKHIMRELILPLIA